MENSSGDLSIRYGAPLHTQIEWADQPQRNDVSPGRSIPVVKFISGGGGVKIDFLHWGFWSFKEQSMVGPKQSKLFRADSVQGDRKVIMANSMTEAIMNSYGLTGSRFTKLLDEERVLIPVNTFYEWNRQSKQKYEFGFDEQITSLAGYSLLSQVTPGQSAVIETVVIITTAANAIMAPFHDRQPVPISHEDEKDWVGGVESGKSYLEHIFNKAQHTEFRLIE